METWMNGAVVIEAAMLSFLMALWISWMSLRGLFRLLPATKPMQSRFEPPHRGRGRWIAMQRRHRCVSAELFTRGLVKELKTPRRARSEIRGSGGIRPCLH